MHTVCPPCTPAVPFPEQISYWRLSKGYKITNYIARDAKRSPDAVVEAVTGLKAQEPVMAWSIDCWHYEMRTVTTWTSDANGNMYPVTSTVGGAALPLQLARMGARTDVAYSYCLYGMVYGTYRYVLLP